MQHALLMGGLASIATGITGTFVLIKRLSYLSGGLAHATLGGMGISYYLGHNPLIGGVVFAILSAIIISWFHFYFKENEETLISALWSIGMAVGILFLYKTPGYSADLHSFLFGNILMTSKESLFILIKLDMILIFFFFVFYRQFISISFDEEFAYLKGLPTKLLYTLLLCLIANTILLLVKAVGLILVIALLTLPTSSLKQHFSSPGKLIFFSCLLSMAMIVGGLFFSYLYNLPAGPLIIFFCGGFYFFSMVVWKKS